MISKKFMHKIARYIQLLIFISYLSHGFIPHHHHHEKDLSCSYDVSLSHDHELCSCPEVNLHSETETHSNCLLCNELDKEFHNHGLFFKERVIAIVAVFKDDFIIFAEENSSEKLPILAEFELITETIIPGIGLRAPLFPKHFFRTFFNSSTCLKNLFININLLIMKNLNAIIILFAMVSFLSCQSKKADVAVSAHSHASKSYTLFSGDLELFAEIDAFTKGHGSSFSIHLTNLNTYKPITDGQVTVSIKGAQTNFNQTIDSPASPGIYHARFVAKTIEKVSLTISYQGANFNESFKLGVFDVYPDDHAAEEAFAADDEEHAGDEIIFTKEQAWEIDFATIELQPQAFNTVIPTSGQLEALPGNISSMIASTDGILHFTKNLMPGQQVKKDEVLFTIDAGQLTSNNLNTKFNSEKAAFEKAKSDLERAEKMVKENIISDKDFRQIQLDFENAKLSFETTGKNFINGRQVIKASQSGIVSELMIQAGDFVSEGQQLGKIINNKKLMLMANLPQSNYLEIDKIRSANFKTGSSDRLYSTAELNAKLISYSITPSMGNSYFPVYFEIENPGNLTAGLFAEVFLESEATENVICIPLSALIESEGHFHVYVQEDGEGYTSRDVKIGSNNGFKAVVLEGLHAGDRVVTKGAYRIKLASLAGELPSHGHVH